MTSRRVWSVALLFGAMATLYVRGADPKYLPDDTEIVVTINLKQMLDSELVKSNKDLLDQAKAHLENLGGNNPAQQYLKDAGFDVMRDLYSVTLTMSGASGKEPTAIIIEGKFDTDKIATVAEKAARDSNGALKIARSGAQTVYEITPPNNEKKLFATLASSKLLLVTSSREGLSDSLARIAGTKEPKLKKEFAVLLSTVNDKQSINFVATGAALSKLSESAPVPNAEAATAALGQIDGLSGAVTFASDIQFQLGVNAKDEAGAKKMAQDGTGMLLGVQFLVGQQAKKDEKFLPIVDIVKTLRVTNQGSNVLLRGSVSKEAIDKLSKSLPGQ